MGLGTHDESTPVERPTRARARFAELVFEHRRSLHGHVRAVYPWADADSVVNSVLAAAWEHLERIEPDRTRAWLRATSRNVVSNDTRQHRRYQAVAEKLVQQDAVATEVAGPDEIDRTELDTVIEALNTLSDPDRELLAMAAAEELTPTELAEIFDVDPNAVRVRLSRARARLRRAMQRPSGSAVIGAVSLVTRSRSAQVRPLAAGSTSTAPFTARQVIVTLRDPNGTAYLTVDATDPTFVQAGLVIDGQVVTVSANRLSAALVMALVRSIRPASGADCSARVLATAHGASPTSAA